MCCMCVVFDCLFSFFLIFFSLLLFTLLLEYRFSRAFTCEPVVDLYSGCSLLGSQLLRRVSFKTPHIRQNLDACPPLLHKTVKRVLEQRANVVATFLERFIAILSLLPCFQSGFLNSIPAFLDVFHGRLGIITENGSSHFFSYLPGNFHHIEKWKYYVMKPVFIQTSWFCDILRSFCLFKIILFFCF